MFNPTRPDSTQRSLCVFFFTVPPPPLYAFYTNSTLLTRAQYMEFRDAVAQPVDRAVSVYEWGSGPADQYMHTIKTLPSFTAQVRVDDVVAFPKHIPPHAQRSPLVIAPNANTTMSTGRAHARRLWLLH